MNSRKNTFLLFGVAFLVLFLVATNISLGKSGALFDDTIGNWVEQFNSGFVIKLMEFASIVGSSEVILLTTVVIGLYFLVKRHWRQFFFFFVLSVGGVILNLALKMLIQRARPGDETKFIEVFNYTFELQSYSFPSGHAMRASILFLFIIYLAVYTLKNQAFKISVIAVSIILLIAVALSRIILDAHYATDVIGAVIVSIAWFFTCLYFFYKPKEDSFSMFK